MLIPEGGYSLLIENIIFINICIVVQQELPPRARLFKAGLSIVTRGTGYETLQVSKAKTKVLQFMLKVLRPCTIFCFMFAHYG